MFLNIIMFTGAGYPRTGTYSLKNALQILGYKCYHFEDVFTTPGHAQIWCDYIENKAGSGAPPPLSKLLAGYDAVVDFPHALYHRELRALCPDAAVLLTKRDPELWAKSMRHLLDTGNTVRRYKWILKYFLTNQLDQYIVIGDFIHKKAFGEMSRKELVESYNSHNELLESDCSVTVMDPKEGWQKLCAVLKVDIPDTPYPHLNSKAGLLKMHIIKNIVKCTFFWYILPLCAIILAFYKLS